MLELEVEKRYEDEKDVQSKMEEFHQCLFLEIDENCHLLLLLSMD